MTGTSEGGRAMRRNAASEAMGAIGTHMGLALVFSAAVNVLFLASPLYMMQLYGRVLNSKSLETLVSLSTVLVLALAAMAAADAARGRLLARAGGRVERLLAPLAARKALDAGKGDAASALGDVETVRRFLSGSAATTLLDTPFTLLFLCVLYILHPLLGLVATLGAAVILVTVGLARLVEARREARVETGTSEVNRLSEGLDSDRGEIRALGLQSGLERRLSTERAAVGGVRLKLGDASATVGATTRFMRMAAHSSALATGAVLALEGTLSPAAMLAAAILAGRALAPMETLLTALRQSGMARGALRRLSDRLDGVGADEMPPAAKSSGDSIAGAGLDVARLVLAEPGGSRAILRSVSFAIRAGETVLIDGPSGAGKSVLGRCLTGAERPKSGDVRIDGVDILALDPAAVSNHIGWLPQEVLLFPGTVLDNVTRFGRIDNAAAYDAARRHGVAGLIERLPQGYQTTVAPGGRNLSPGARQAVGLLRAIAGARAAVILDQPTSQMDAEGEVAALNAIRRLKADGVTVVVISHKPVLATLADRIMLMRDGTVELFEDRQTVLDAMRRQSLRAVAPAPAQRPAGDGRLKTVGSVAS
jgi:PrtD family type I secretion system ABC transporter